MESHWPESWTGDVHDGYDIAVVRLNKKANLTLPSIATQGGDFRRGKLFTALGWGLNKSGKQPNSLQMADSLLYVRNLECKDFLGDAVKKHSICAGLLSDSCRGLLFVSITLCYAFFAEGDSGGPLLIANVSNGSLATGHPEFDQLVGVTSIGSEDCSDGSPVVYTSIGAFWDWILWKIGEGPEVNCSPILFFCPDRFVQVPEPSEEPSPSVPSFSKVDEPADDKPKEKLNNRNLKCGANSSENYRRKN